MDKIIVKGAPFQCHIGVTDAERAVPQVIVVDLTLDVDTRTAAATDSVGDTVDYVEVVAALAAIAASLQFRLLETLADRMVKRILEFPPVANVTLRLRKPGALRAQGAQFAAIEISRARNG